LKLELEPFELTGNKEELAVFVVPVTEVRRKSGKDCCVTIAGILHAQYVDLVERLQHRVSDLDSENAAFQFYMAPHRNQATMLLNTCTESGLLPNSVPTAFTSVRRNSFSVACISGRAGSSLSAPRHNLKLTCLSLPPCSEEECLERIRKCAEHLVANNLASAFRMVAVWAASGAFRC